MIFIFIHLFVHFGDIYLRTPRGDMLRNHLKHVFTSGVHFSVLHRLKGGIYLRRRFMGNLRYLQEFQCTTLTFVCRFTGY